MPNAAPPPPRRPDGSRPRTAGAPAAGPPAGARPAGGAQEQRPASSAAALAGLPTSWSGAAALLARTGAVRPGAAPPVSVSLLHATQPSTVHVDLSGMWAAPAQASAPTSLLELRRLDDKHRLVLPIAITGAGTTRGAMRLPAQRKHAVLTVFLPDAPGAPTPGRSVAPLALAARGRLTLGQIVCAELGLSAGCAVAVVLDPQHRTLSICAASHLTDAVRAGVDAARRPPVKPSLDDAGSGQPHAAAPRPDATVVPLRRPS